MAKNDKSRKQLKALVDRVGPLLLGWGYTALVYRAREISEECHADITTLQYYHRELMAVSNDL